MHSTSVEGGRVPTIRKTTSRGEFLRLGGAGLAGLALLGSTRSAFGQTSGGTAVSAPTLGIDKNNTAAQNRANLVEALRYSNKDVTFPSGDYYIDNSGSHLVIDEYGGTLTMEAGARFVFTDNTTCGLYFYGGTGAKFYKLNSTFQESPPDRTSPQGCIQLDNSTDTLVQDANVDGSAGAGLLFWQCVRPSVNGAVIKNTMADGLHFANCQDAVAEDVSTDNTGDDGLAFLNYADLTDYSGGHATNITVKNSRARGIAVLGQRDVTIDGFRVDGTSCPGLYCAYESSWHTRVTSNVRFANGSVHNAGRVSGLAGNGFGIYYERVSSVSFEGIRVTSPKTRGVSGTAPDGRVVLKDIEAQDAPQSGFDLRAQELHLSNLHASNAGYTGIYVADSELVRYDELTSTNAAKSDTLRRAFSFEHNARVEGDALRVVDNQEESTGYKVNAYGEQSGTLGKVYNHVRQAELQIENSSGLAYTLEGTGEDFDPSLPSPPSSPRRRRRRRRRRR